MSRSNAASTRASPFARILAWSVLAGLAGLLLWAVTRPPRKPDLPRWQTVEADLGDIAREARERADTELVRALLAEDLADRHFSFATVVAACSGKRVVPLDRSDPVHVRVVAAIDAALATTTASLSRADSPLRSLSRINEASRFFEDGLRERLAATSGFTCAIPSNRRGDPQRSGYPDLRLVDEATGKVFYLDPKLVGDDAWDSTFRSFYFEPKDETLKITDDAVHLLVGIEHDGRDGEWTFGPWKLVDLSTLDVRLKAEFQASNKDLYPSPATDNK